MRAAGSAASAVLGGLLVRPLLDQAGSRAACRASWRSGGAAPARRHCASAAPTTYSPSLSPSRSGCATNTSAYTYTACWHVTARRVRAFLTAVPTGRLGSPPRRAALLRAEGRLKPLAAARRATCGWWWGWWWPGPLGRRLCSRRSTRRPAQPAIPRLVARHHGGPLLPRPDVHGLPKARLPRAQTQAVLPPRRAALRSAGTSIVILGGHGRIITPRMGVWAGGLSVRRRRARFSGRHEGGDTLS